MNQEITALLQAAGRGDSAASDRMFEVVYGELRKIARSHRRRWVGNETLSTTALIHEAFIKLSGQDDWQSRTHFYATAAKAMRHILVNYAESRRRAKRGGNSVPIPLDDVLLASDDAAEEMLNLHQSLEALEQDHDRACRVLECRFFGGMNIDETAEALGVSPATVRREWKFARAWLYRHMGTDLPQVGGEPDPA